MTGTGGGSGSGWRRVVIGADADVVSYIIAPLEALPDSVLKVVISP